MDYEIKEIEEFVLVGKKKAFNGNTSLGEIPKFWEEYYRSGSARIVCGCYGVCLYGKNCNGEFEYMIGDNFDPKTMKVPDGFVTVTIPEHTWAIFNCVGPVPQALQAMTKEVFCDWLPNNGKYVTTNDCSIEMYTEGDLSSADYRTQIWLPVVEK